MPDINQYMPRSGRIIKEDNTVVNEAAGINADGSRNVQLAGSTLDLRGLAANKPAAASVAVGTTYWAVNTGIIEVSTGAAWVVV